MDYKIELPTVSEILVEEFMEPSGVTAYRLAKEIYVPVSRIQDIIKGRRKVTVDTSIRLGKFFGVSEKYFLNIQNDIDCRLQKILMKDEIEKIHKLQPQLA